MDGGVVIAVEISYRADRPLVVDPGAWIARSYLTGACFRYRSVWPRTDFFSRPECTPPFHGATAYSELDLVWEHGHEDETRFGMFRYFAPRAWFDLPPYVAGVPAPELSP